MPFVTFEQESRKPSKRVKKLFWEVLDFYGISRKQHFQKWPLRAVNPEISDRNHQEITVFERSQKWPLRTLFRGNLATFETLFCHFYVTFLSIQSHLDGDFSTVAQSDINVGFRDHEIQVALHPDFSRNVGKTCFFSRKSMFFSSNSEPFRWAFLRKVP